ncbi:MAG: PDZ domain-containing protein [Planctomycetes bacterium]|nr:PDZ domain-containing protein [Planctomycetota bacterium]
MKCSILAVAGLVLLMPAVRAQGLSAQADAKVPTSYTIPADGDHRLAGQPVGSWNYNHPQPACVCDWMGDPEKGLSSRTLVPFVRFGALICRIDGGPWQQVTMSTLFPAGSRVEFWMNDNPNGHGDNYGNVRFELRPTAPVQPPPAPGPRVRPQPVPPAPAPSVPPRREVHTRIEDAPVDRVAPGEPYLGIVIRTADLVVLEVQAQSPAQAMGMRPDDRILTIAGQVLRDAEALRRVRCAQRIGTSVPVIVLRDGAPLELQWRVASRPTPNSPR